MASNVLNQSMDYKLIYKPSIVANRSHHANHKYNQCVHFLTRDRLHAHGVALMAPQY